MLMKSNDTPRYHCFWKPLKNGISAFFHLESCKNWGGFLIFKKRTHPSFPSTKKDGGCLVRKSKKKPSNQLEVCGKMVPTWWTKVSVARLPILALLAITPLGKLRRAKRKIWIFFVIEAGLVEKVWPLNLERSKTKNTARWRVLLGSLYVYVLVCNVNIYI